jgi:hypothetical protein
MRLLLCLLLVCWFSPSLHAQIIPRKSAEERAARRKANREIKGKLLGFELAGGLNAAVFRRPLSRLIDSDGSTPYPGGELQVNVFLRPARRNPFIIGLDMVHDRGIIRNYRKGEEFLQTYSTGFLEFDGRKRAGDLRFQESWLRLHAGWRLGKGRVTFQPEFSVSFLLGSRWRYDYVDTVTAFYDFVTNTIIPLDEPIHRPGQRETPSDLQQDYSSLSLGIGYRLNPKLELYIRTDLGLHIGGIYISEGKQNRSRLSLGLRGRVK